MITLETTFRYRHAFGDREPYLDGLRQARAMASRCAGCGKAWFPPQLHCCGHIDWVELAGTGTVRALTEGDECWGLIALDGACNLALGRVERGLQEGARVRLTARPISGDHPAAAVWFIATVET